MLFFFNFLFINEPQKSITGSKKKKKNPAQLFPSLIINQHIRMIPKGSYDTEDWSNDAENLALNHRNKLYFKIEKHYFQL